MQVHHCRTAEHLVERLVTLWSGPRQDPFAFDLAVVPGPGFQRWLSQQLATAGDAPGICAGVEFTSFDALERRLGGADDPWRPGRLAWLVQQVALASTGPELEVLRTHLAASRESWSASRRIAVQLAGYARHRPAMLAAWADGADTGPDGEPLVESAWQPALYRLLLAELGDSPLDRRDAVAARLRDAPVEGLPARVAVPAPERLSGGRLALLEALGAHHRVDLLLLAPSLRRPEPASGTLRRAEFARPAGHPLNEALAAESDEAALLLAAPAAGAPAPHAAPPGATTTLLGALQADLAADRPPAGTMVLDRADDSVQVHLSHGRDRQVEVLREVLTGLLAADPTLEPRDIVVLTPDVDAYAPLLAAGFGSSGGGHPAQRFRVQVADRSVAQVNPMVSLLLDVLRLPDSRVEASTLLELCAHPAVARRFGFSADSRERLAELVTDAGVRWGLSPAHRGAYGLAGFRQNTWFAGLQRMLLGVALGETDLVSAGTVLPLDDVGSSDVDLVGGLTELVGRLSRLMAEFERPGTLAEWVERCRGALSVLAETTHGEEWQLGDVWAALSRLGERAGGSNAVLPRHAALRAIESEFADTAARGAFGNGSLVVCGLRSLRHVPHRVVVLLGWDAERYPRPARTHGDDLLGLEPLVGDPSAALADRQALLDAIHATRETLVVVARGRSEASNEDVPPAAPLAALLEALDATASTADGRPAGAAVTVQHPLQPFDPRYFDPACRGLSSVDRLAFRAATAALAEPEQPRGRFHLEMLPPPDLTAGVTLADLVSFFGHPARALLRQRAGISLGDSPEAGDAIPIEPDHLARWHVGNRVLQRLREGRDATAVATAELLRGDVPPFRLGYDLLDQVVAGARRSVREVPSGLPAPTLHDLALTVDVPGHGAVPLVGRVSTHGRELLQAEFSSLQARHRLTSWLRLLALAAAEDGPWRARVIGKGRRAVYEAPPREAASALLGRYLAIYALGLSRPLPALPRLGAEWVSYRLSHRDPHDRLVSRKNFQRCWDYDSDASWESFFEFPGVLDLPLDGLDLPGAHGETTLVGALAASIWTPILDSEVAP